MQPEQIGIGGIGRDRRRAECHRDLARDRDAGQVLGMVLVPIGVDGVVGADDQGVGTGRRKRAGRAARQRAGQRDLAIEHHGVVFVVQPVAVALDENLVRWKQLARESASQLG